MRSRLRVIIGGAAEFANDFGTLRPRERRNAMPVLFAFAEGRGVVLAPPNAEERCTTARFLYKFYPPTE